MLPTCMLGRSRRRQGRNPTYLGLSFIQLLPRNSPMIGVSPRNKQRALRGNVLFSEFIGQICFGRLVEG
jgi:hypothetical protein